MRATLDTTELFDAMVTLAREVGLEVRITEPSPIGTETNVSSGTCRVRDSVWIVLSQADPREHQIEVIAGALRTHAGSLLEERWLPPALRESIDL